MKTKKITKEQIVAWSVYSIMMCLFMIFFFGYLRFQDGSEMIDPEFRFIVTYMLPIGLGSTISGIIAAASARGKYILILLLGYIPAIIFMIVMYTIAFFFDNDRQNTNQGEYTPGQTQDGTIITKSGSEWKITNQKDTYYHVVKYGESLEYIFNDIHLSLQKAQEQHFEILKKDSLDKFEIIPIENYGHELKQGTYLYSGLNPGDTVYLLKHELEKFRVEKHVSE